MTTYTTYVTQEQSEALAKCIGAYRRDDKSPPSDWDAGDSIISPSQLHALCNASIQHYRDSLAAGVVLPNPRLSFGPGPSMLRLSPGDYYTADQLRQAIADALAKQVPDEKCSMCGAPIGGECFLQNSSQSNCKMEKQDTRAPMFEFRECEDSQAGSCKMAKQAPNNWVGSGELKHWVSPIAGKWSDLPVEGFVILDPDMRKWAQDRDLHIFCHEGEFHVMRAKKWMTSGYPSAQEAIEALWESGEADDLSVLDPKEAV